MLIDANGLDLASYTLLKNAGFKLTGKVGGNFEMVNDAGKGRFWLKNVTSRELKVKGFPVPDLDFDKGWIETELKGDRLMIRKLDLDGKELKIRDERRCGAAGAGQPERGRSRSSRQNGLPTNSPRSSPCSRTAIPTGST